MREMANEMSFLTKFRETKALVITRPVKPGGRGYAAVDHSMQEDTDAAIHPPASRWACGNCNDDTRGASYCKMLLNIESYHSSGPRRRYAH